MPTPWCQTPSLQSWSKTHFCCLNHQSGVLCYHGPRRLICYAESHFCPVPLPHQPRQLVSWSLVGSKVTEFGLPYATWSQSTYYFNILKNSYLLFYSEKPKLKYIRFYLVQAFKNQLLWLVTRTLKKLREEWLTPEWRLQKQVFVCLFYILLFFFFHGTILGLQYHISFKYST